MDKGVFLFSVEERESTRALTIGNGSRCVTGEMV